jgi:hypothetical protein
MDNFNPDFVCNASGKFWFQERTGTNHVQGLEDKA